MNKTRLLFKSRLFRSAVTAALIVILLAPLFVPTNAAAAQSGSVGYRGFSFPNGTGVDDAATGEKPESKLWWVDGFWYGSLWSQSANSYTIHRFNVGSQNWTDTGVRIDDRLGSKADALWDGSRLFIVSHLFVENNARSAPAGSRGELYVYSYNPSTRVFSLNSGFPVEVNNAITETLVVDKDSSGRLWVTYVESNRVMVNRSTSSDYRTWGTPFALPAGGMENVTADDISSLITYNNYVGVMWSRQTSPRTMYFAVHTVGNSHTNWSHIRSYSVSGDDHINLKSLQSDSAGNLFAVVKTENNSALIVVLVCRSANCRNESDWNSYVVYNSVAYNPTRPMMVIDETNRHLYVFTRNEPSGSGPGGIYYKRANLDNISFSPGALGTPFINNSTDTEVNDPTGSKHNVNAATGLLILASDPRTNYYLHNFIDLGGSPTPPPQGYSLSVATQGGGTVSMSPSLALYSPGAQVTLTAHPAPGWAFSGWQGDLSGSTNPATITMDGNKSILALFYQPNGGTNNIYLATVINGTALNSSSVSTSSVVDGAGTPSLYLAAVTTRNALAVASVSGLGLSWTRLLRQCAARGSTMVDLWMAQGTPSANSAVTAVFASSFKSAVISVSRYTGAHASQPIGALAGANTRGLNGACSGGTDSSSYAFNLTTTASDAVIYVAASMRNRTHSPGSGFTERAETFAGSGGDVASIALEDKTAAPAGTTGVDGTFSGSVDWSVIGLEIRPEGGSSPPPTPTATATAPANPTPTSTATATNTPAPTATTSPTFTPTLNPTPTNPPQTYTLNTAVQGSGQVMLSPAGGAYSAGTVVSLTAQPAPGWQFNGWQGSLSGSANPTSIMMDGNKSVTAVFTEQTGGGGTVTHEDTVSGTALESASVSTPPSLSGSGLYLAAVTSRNAATVANVTGLGLNWTPVLRQCAARNSVMVDLWMAYGTPSAAGAVTAEFGAPVKTAVISVTRYNGANSSQPLGTVTGANTLGAAGGCSGGTDTSAYAFDITPSTPGSVIYAAASMRNRAHSPGAGYTERIETAAGSGGDVASIAVEDKAAAGGANAVSGTFSGTVDWSVIAVEIRP